MARPVSVSEVVSFINGHTVLILFFRYNLKAHGDLHSVPLLHLLLFRAHTADGIGRDKAKISAALHSSANILLDRSSIFVISAVFITAS